MKMGAKLSAQQRGIYFQVVGILDSEGKGFSKGLLKRFVRRLFLHFLKASLEEVVTVPFGNTVWNKLTELSNKEDTSVNKFFSLFVIIWSVIFEKRKAGEQTKQLSPVFPSLSPKPLSSKLGGLCGAYCPQVQGSC